MERIRKLSDAPVICVSGHGSSQNMDRAFELGAADYIVKPFTPTDLVARSKVAVRGGLAQRSPRFSGSRGHLTSSPSSQHACP